ncbi:hypothetical protein [Rhizobium sp. NFR07]|uniref:hypothetical protein n=1 Tax=Rhizobium sp. NFR07 TaxID=1566262 RepID=UPI00116098FE|nr:hypothetical protein [Rhizobium sp. NFR07]
MQLNTLSMPADDMLDFVKAKIGETIEPSTMPMSRDGSRKSMETPCSAKGDFKCPKASTSPYGRQQDWAGLRKGAGRRSGRLLP